MVKEIKIVVVEKDKIYDRIIKNRIDDIYGIVFFPYKEVEILPNIYMIYSIEATEKREKIFKYNTTVNEIMREMSVPNREMPDGADGKILIYEDIKFVTTSSNTHNTHSNSASYGSAVAGYNYRGNPQVNSNAYGYSSTTNTDRGKSVSEEQKKYVNFFINPEGVCYDVKANYGDLYKRIPGKYQTCLKRQMSIAGFMWWAFPPAGIIYTICYAIMDGKPIKNSCGNIYEE